MSDHGILKVDSTASPTKGGSSKVARSQSVKKLVSAGVSMMKSAKSFRGLGKQLSRARSSENENGMALKSSHSIDEGSGHQNMSPEDERAAANNKRLYEEAEALLDKEVKMRIEPEKRRMKDAALAMLEDICRGSRFVAAELWSVPASESNAERGLPDDDDEDGDQDDDDQQPQALIAPTTTSAVSSSKRRRSSLFRRGNALGVQIDSSPRVDSLPKALASATPPSASKMAWLKWPSTGGLGVSSKESSREKGKEKESTESKADSASVVRSEIGSAGTGGDAVHEDGEGGVGGLTDRSGVEGGKGGKRVGVGGGSILQKRGVNASVNVKLTEEIAINAMHLPSAKVDKTAAKKRKKGLRKAIKRTNVQAVYGEITEQPDKLVFTGRRFVKQALFDLAQRPRSVYSERKIDVAKCLKELEEVALSQSYGWGQGLPGEAWSKSDMVVKVIHEEKALERNSLPDVLETDDSTHGDEPTKSLSHEEAASKIFRSAVAIPIWELARPHPLAAVVVLYAPLEHGQEWIHQYICPKQNPRLVGFLQEMAAVMPLALRWVQRDAAWDVQVQSFTTDPKVKAKRMWRVLRIVVRTKWIKRCATDNTPRTPLAKLWASIQLIGPILHNFFEKWKGQHLTPPPAGDLRHTFQTAVGTLIACFVLSLVHQRVTDVSDDYVLLVGSFAAVIALIFSSPSSPYSQPRNVFIGNLIGAVVGIVFDYFSNPKFEQTYFMPVWVAATVAPVITIGLMALTATTHPPAAACTIIYTLGNETIKDLWWNYTLFPTSITCSLLIVIGLIINNIFPNRKYPLFW